MLHPQVPLKFRYPFLPQIMWYAADKYVRLLEQDKKEQGLISTPKKDETKQSTPKKKDLVSAKEKSSNKKPVKTDAEGKEEETSPLPKKGLVEEDTVETPGRRRSSRVARQAQENEEKEKAVKKEEADGVNGKKRSPKKNKDKDDKLEMNGEEHEEEDEDKNMPDAGEENGEQEEKKPWRPVYLTRFEVDGLNKLIEKLRKWPQAEKNVPSSLEDPYGLLERLEVCVFFTFNERYRNMYVGWTCRAAHFCHIYFVQPRLTTSGNDCSGY